MSLHITISRVDCQFILVSCAGSAPPCRLGMPINDGFAVAGQCSTTGSGHSVSPVRRAGPGVACQVSTECLLAEGVVGLARRLMSFIR